jgi:5-methylcytosine-specific restriction endonuclease McrBC GTP-binding regulatory subunit McrB
MIKLTDLLEATSINKKKSLDADFLQKGFKLSEPEINPETGTSSTTVTYLPKFEEIRRQILTMRKEFQPFKFSSNPDIAGVAKDINTNMTKLSQLIFALDKMIELQRK